MLLNSTGDAQAFTLVCLQLPGLAGVSTALLAAFCRPQPSGEDSPIVETLTVVAAPFLAWVDPPGAAR